jgi:hypothetical protein
VEGGVHLISAADSLALAADAQTVRRLVMQRAAGRIALVTILALFFGFAVTGVGFKLQWHQMNETFRSQSVAPLLHPGTNLKISACLPVIKAAQKVGDFGFPVFVLLVVANICFWATIAMALYLAARRMTRRGEHAPAA